MVGKMAEPASLRANSTRIGVGYNKCGDDFTFPPKGVAGLDSSRGRTSVLTHRTERHIRFSATSEEQRAQGENTE